MRAALLSSELFATPASVHEVPKPNGDTPRRAEWFVAGVLEASSAVTMDIGAPVLLATHQPSTKVSFGHAECNDCSTVVSRRANGTPIQLQTPVSEIVDLATPYGLFTKTAQSTALENVGLKRARSGTPDQQEVFSL